jgi:hypothetical protein
MKYCVLRISFAIWLANCFPETGAKCNGTTSLCGGLLANDEVPCPPDSVPKDPSVPGSPCECAPAACRQPVCRFGSTRELRRTGTKLPGDCCDVYECVQPKGKPSPVSKLLGWNMS